MVCSVQGTWWRPLISLHRPERIEIPDLPSASRRTACTKEGSKQFFSATSSGRYLTGCIVFTADLFTSRAGEATGVLSVGMQLWTFPRLLVGSFSLSVLMSTTSKTPPKKKKKKISCPRSPRGLTGGWVVIQRCEPISATVACCLFSAPRQTLRISGSADREAPRPSATLLAIYWDWRCWKTKTIPAERIPIGHCAQMELIKVEVALGQGSD